MSAMTGGVTTSTATMSSSMIELRGVFLNSFNIITDAMGVFVKGLHKHAGSVLDDLADIKKAMKDVGLGSSAGRELGELGSSSRRSNLNTRQQELKLENVKLDGYDMKRWVQRVGLDNISDNM